MLGLFFGTKSFNSLIQVVKCEMTYQDLLRLATFPKGILGLSSETDGLMDNCKLNVCNTDKVILIMCA